MTQAFTGGGYIQSIVSGEVGEFLYRCRSSPTVPVDLAPRRRAWHDGASAGHAGRNHGSRIWSLGAPRKRTPEITRNLILAAPNTHFVILARSVLFRGAGLDVVWPQLLALFGIGATLFVLSLW